MIIREMKADEADVVSGMVHGLARDLKLGVVPELTGEKLLASSRHINVMVAAEGGKVVGACLWLMTYSTFRAAAGMYVVDLFVDGSVRNRNIGLQLLKGAAAAAEKQGAKYIKLEVDIHNQAGARFYERIGFIKKSDDQLFVLEQAGLTQLTREKS